MLKRTIYLNRIIPYLDKKDLIKVLIGLRRSGKSVLLKQLISYLEENRKINKKNIIYINYESLEFSHLNDYHNLYNYIKEKIKNNQRYYIFIGEIQLVNEWEKAINSFRIDFDCEIFITGSNSKLLSSELATLIAGRYILFEIFPFRFLEIKEYYQLKNINISDEEIYKEYLTYGGIPQLLDFNYEQKSEYLNTLYSTIILKDIISRYHIADYSTLQRIINYAIDNISNRYSVRGIADYLKSNKFAIGNAKVYDYFSYCQNVFLLYQVQRNDIKGKKILNGNEKYYLSDIGFRQIRQSDDFEIGKVMENIVFIELKIRGYKVYTGNIGNYEIDFIAEKSNERIYIQVCYLLSSKEVEEREIRSLMATPDNYPKYLISADQVNFSKKGIIHLNILQFLNDIEII